MKGFELNRREALFAGAASAFVTGTARASGSVTNDPLETMIRMRASTDGRISFGWLDAVRETVIDGEIAPFCRVLAGAISKARRLSPDLYELRVVEVAFYLDPQTGALLGRKRMPVTGTEVDVPIYRAGPAAVKFAVSFDEWESHDPAGAGAAARSMAPPGQVHLQRNINSLRREGDEIFLRTNEYGRLYQSRDKPPSVYYREWMIWRASAADVESAAPDIHSEYSYSALSSWRPWMRMGTVKGHTVENGRGAKTSSAEAWPSELIALARAHHPDVLDEHVKLMQT